MQFEFSAEIWEWRGPAPFYYVTVPAEISTEIKANEAMLTYGWGVIPVRAIIGNTEFTTSLFPKDGLYVLGLKVAVRKPEQLEVGQVIDVQMFIG
jgi:hypothetical protein